MPNVVEILIQAQDKASPVFKSLADSGDSLVSKLKVLGPAIAGAVGGFLSLRALEGAVETTTHLGEAVRKLSQESGLSAESSSHLIAAFDQVGLNSDDASRSMGIFAKNLVNTRDSLLQGKAAATPFGDSLKVLHINAIGAGGALVPFDDVLAQLADRFSTLPDSEEKTARAMDLFGKSGKDMIPLLNLGSEGLKEAAIQADKLGLTLSGSNVEGIHKFVLAEREMNAELAGLKVRIGTEVLPALTGFLQSLTPTAEFAIGELAKLGGGFDTSSTERAFLRIQIGLVNIAIEAKNTLKDIGSWFKGIDNANEKVKGKVRGFFESIGIDPDKFNMLNGGAGFSGGSGSVSGPAIVGPPSPPTGLEKLRADLEAAMAHVGDGFKALDPPLIKLPPDLSALGAKAKAVGDQMGSAFDQLLSMPTRESADLKLKLAELDEQIARRGPLPDNTAAIANATAQLEISKKNGGAFQDSIQRGLDLLGKGPQDDLQKQHDAIARVIAIEDAHSNVLKAQFATSNNLLLTDSQREDIARGLISNESTISNLYRTGLIPNTQTAIGWLAKFGGGLEDLVNWMAGIPSKATGGGAPQNVPNAFQGAN